MSQGYYCPCNLLIILDKFNSTSSVCPQSCPQHDWLGLEWHGGISNPGPLLAELSGSEVQGLVLRLIYTPN